MGHIDIQGWTLLVISLAGLATLLLATLTKLALTTISQLGQIIKAWEHMRASLDKASTTAHDTNKKVTAIAPKVAHIEEAINGANHSPIAPPVRADSPDGKRLPGHVE